MQSSQRFEKKYQGCNEALEDWTAFIITSICRELDIPMKRFYLSGQNNFGNRGCEALVRSTLELLKSEFGEVEVLVPSYRPDLDAKQWPDAEKNGCRFVQAMHYPIELK